MNTFTYLHFAFTIMGLSGGKVNEGRRTGFLKDLILPSMKANKRYYRALIGGYGVVKIGENLTGYDLGSLPQVVLAVGFLGRLNIWGGKGIRAAAKETAGTAIDKAKGFLRHPVKSVQGTAQIAANRFHEFRNSPTFSHSFFLVNNLNTMGGVAKTLFAFNVGFRGLELGIAHASGNEWLKENSSLWIILGGRPP